MEQLTRVTLSSGFLTRYNQIKKPIDALVICTFFLDIVDRYFSLAYHKILKNIRQNFGSKCDIIRFSENATPPIVCSRATRLSFKSTLK